jgi:hypothetical protein
MNIPIVTAALLLLALPRGPSTTGETLLAKRTAALSDAAQKGRNAAFGVATRTSRGRELRALQAFELSSRRSPESVAAFARDPHLCPPNMVMIGQKFCVDQYEASLLQVLPDGRETPWSPYHPVPQGVVVRAITGPGAFPQGYISGVQSKAACEHSGKRLCKPEEWKKACMGPQETMFPYGPKRRANVCNDHGRSSMQFYNPGLSDKPEDSWKWGALGNMMDPRLNQLEGTLAKTGEHTGCTNDYGVYDMVGNLHEWVDDPRGTFQGGYYLDTHLNADGCYYRTTVHEFSHVDYSTGFRCCTDVDPLP